MPFHRARDDRHLLSIPTEIDMQLGRVHTVRYRGKETPQNEVAMDILCSSAAKTEFGKVDECFRWFGKRLGLDQFLD